MMNFINTPRGAADPDWEQAEEKFLAAIPLDLRSRARSLLLDPRRGGRGLRAFVGLLAIERRPLPARLPDALIDVYLRDDEAEPLHDCEVCGLPLPVRSSRRAGHESNPEIVYFTACPSCGGRTGRFAYWSRAAVPQSADGREGT